MKIDHFGIVIDRRDNVFITGEKLEGRVVLRLNKPVSISAIYLTFTGKAKSKWDVYKQDTNKTYRGYESYIDETKSLFVAGGPTAEFEPGTYAYPFSIILPRSIPSSFEGRKGSIRYWCQAVIERKHHEELDTEAEFTVIHPLDLNTIPSARDPSVVQKEEMVESCCCEAGLVFLQLKIEKSGYVPGELIHFIIECHNNTNAELGHITLELLQNVTYTGYSESLFSSHQPKYHTKTIPILLYEGREGVVQHKYTSIKQSVLLPAMPPSKLDGCTIITTEYELSLNVDAGIDGIGCSMFITIGTVPLRTPVFRGPIIRQAPSPTNQSAVAYESQVTPIFKVIDAPPSYEECVFGQTVSNTNGKSEETSSRHNIPMSNMASSISQSQPVTVQPTSSSDQSIHPTD